MACKKFVSDLWLGDDFHRVPQYTPPRTTDSKGRKEGMGFYVALNSLGHIATR